MEEEKKIIFQQEDYAPDEMLTNPFFYKTREDRVISLEDFAIRVKLGLFKKKEQVYLRSVVRNPNIKKSKRFKIFSKYIRENKKAFEDNLYLQKEENDKKKENLKKLDIKKFKIGRLFLVILLMAVSVFLSLLFISKDFVSSLNLAFLEEMHEHMASRMDSYYYLLVIIPNLFLVLYFVYLLYFGISNHKFVKMEKRKQHAFEKYSATAKKALNKCYKRIMKYYRHNIYKDEQFYEALMLEELWDLKVDITDADRKLEEEATNNKKVVKRNKNYSGYNKLFMTIILLPLIVLLGYEIYSIFK